MKLLSTSCLFLIRSTNAFSSNRTFTLLSSTKTTAATRSFTSTTLKMSEKPFSVIVEAEIKEDRMDEFMTMIENNANKSRQEPGCIRFDVLQDQSQKNKFWFYEVYENAAAVDFHKTQAHYQGWADFKESGGTISSVSHKADGVFIGGKASS
ncbi:autoinducer-2 modifying protein LsrG [Nitzschia inconspicua]|uniref:Autoinducer-2 modifying protein LsrG n=1 Tax=Nitzschia inconspicua TaxID=303405 RepID=A0A9K3PGK5_9STRA|nr:autoinducer-2 modifying protein LsrG [Nitzschia inconspicua]